MRFHTQSECETWLASLERRKPETTATVRSERIKYPDKPYRVFGVAHWIATSLTYRLPTLLCITEWGVWPTSENLHLYYRLRQTYGDIGS